jgi:hypothetical protein
MGSKVLVAADSDVVRTEVPAGFRPYVDDGIPVEDVTDGLRLAEHLPTIYAPADIAEGLDRGQGELTPVNSCTGDGGSYRIPCDKPHDEQLYAVVQSPFTRYPGSSVMISFAQQVCTQKLTPLLDTLGPIGSAITAENGYGATFGWYAARWNTKDWNNGDREIGCVVAGNNWKLTGALPDAVVSMHDDVMWTPQWTSHGPEIQSTPKAGAVDLMYNIAFPEAPATDLTVTAYHLDPATAVGLACRFTDQGGYLSGYALSVGMDGLAQITKAGNPLVTLVTKQTTLRATDLLSAVLRATCVQSGPAQPVVLSLSVNGQQVATATDSNSPLPGGNIGVYVNGRADFTDFQAVMSRSLTR